MRRAESVLSTLRLDLGTARKSEVLKIWRKGDSNAETIAQMLDIGCVSWDSPDDLACLLKGILTDFNVEFAEARVYKSHHDHGTRTLLECESPRRRSL